MQSAKDRDQQAADREPDRPISPIPPPRNPPPPNWDASLQRIIDTAKRHELRYHLDSENGTDPKKYVLNLIGLQRFILHDIQSRIVEQVSRPERNPPVPQLNAPAQQQNMPWDELRESVHDYCEAVRDLRYMLKWEVRGDENQEMTPFRLTSSRELERTLLKKYGLMDRRYAYQQSKDKLSPQLPSGKRRTHDPEILDDLPWYEQAGVAVLAVLPIIGPALLILYVQKGFVNWLAPGIALALVMIIVTWIPTLHTRDVLTIVVGYASVLVVFVGLNAEPANR